MLINPETWGIQRWLVLAQAWYETWNPVLIGNIFLFELLLHVLSSFFEGANTTSPNKLQLSSPKWSRVYRALCKIK